MIIYELFQLQLGESIEKNQNCPNKNNVTKWLEY